MVRSPHDDRSSLSALLESEIIPRLMLAHGVAPVPSAPAPDAICAAVVDAFAGMAVGGGADDLLAEVERMLARDITVESLLVDLLAPAARRLGTLWEDDRCDFVEVTMGLWRLQEMVRELSARGRHGDPGASGRRALFAAMPGDQHGFGAVVIDEMFRRNGWASDIAIGATMPDLLEQVGREWIDLVGLTVSCDCNIARLPSVILAVRSVSRNPRLRVMVGGRVFVDDPALADRVGADATAPDARSALAAADALVDAVVCVA